MLVKKKSIHRWLDKPPVDKKKLEDHFVGEWRTYELQSRVRIVLWKITYVTHHPLRAIQRKFLKLAGLEKDHLVEESRNQGFNSAVNLIKEKAAALPYAHSAQVSNYRKEIIKLLDETIRKSRCW